MPRAQDVLIPEEKLRDYLLSESHPVGRAKARFFKQFGFTDAAIAEMDGHLRAIARTGEVAETKVTEFGMKYVIDGEIECDDGRKLLLRTVWIVLSPGESPRFVTAHPI